MPGSAAGPHQLRTHAEKAAGATNFVRISYDFPKIFHAIFPRAICISSEIHILYNRLRPNSITLSRSHIGRRPGRRPAYACRVRVADRSKAGRKPAANWSATRFELSRHVETAGACLRQVGNHVHDLDRPVRELVSSSRAG